MAKFEDLSDDVLYIILQHLHLERSNILYHFRILSPRLNAFAESVLYRNIVLEDDDQHELSSYRAIERLGSPKDPLSQHVRSLHVKSFKGDEESFCMNQKFLLVCLNNIQRLRSFSWDSDLPLPDELLDTIHRRFPDAQLCTSLKSLDQPVLRSPQLYRLGISMPCSESDPGRKIRLWEQLKQALLQCRNLRTLSLDVHPELAVQQEHGKRPQNVHSSLTIEPTRVQNGISSIKSPGTAVNDAALVLYPLVTETVQLPLEPGDKLPTLQDFDIRANNYNLDAKHCTQLLDCMDWKRLKRLRLGPSDPKTFFEMFKYKVPQLEILEFTYSYEFRYHGPFTAYSPKLTACADFIASITALKELVVRCDGINLQDRLWMALVEVHGEHLQSLSIKTRYQGIEAPECKGNLGDLLLCLSSLTTLNLALRASFSNSSMCSFCPSPTHWLSTNYISSIPVIRSLRSLHVSVRVNLSDRSLYPTVADHAHCAILKVWIAYTNHAEDCELETFNMTFWRWEPTSPHPDEYGNSRNAHISKLTFESKKVGDRLVIKPRRHRQISEIYYRPVWEETTEGKLQATYVAEQLNVPRPPFILSSRFHKALGSLFQQPANGARVVRY
ncbi:hypothetical protein BKA66DRAFT_473378 [Pyrenochaeta sp. MPI-SDFR-AT-0127]|nr:hypothetical protein BKA66DRAFT_473378 [Pyrenochaeta sp. MPI-SDFR-AT-0127]